jgi:hypothetical protein
MICEHCHKENRSIAKFCKWCGQPLVSQNVLDRMIGLDDVKKQLKTVVDTYTYLHSRKDVMNVRLSVNAISLVKQVRVRQHWQKLYATISISTKS